MQRSLLASVIIMSLSACDGKTLAIATDNTAANNPTTTTTPVEVQSSVASAGSTMTDTSTDTGNTTPVTIVTNTESSSNDTDAVNNGDKYETDNTMGDSSNNTDKPTNSQISDDAGSSSSDGGQISDDAASSSSDGGQIADDAASGSSDGGQIADDAASGSSDGGQIADDAASGSSDGGQIADDAASGSSDGAQIADDAASGSSDGGQSNQGVLNTNAGSFASDNIGANTIRVSSLASNTSANICTTTTARNDYSDTRVGDFILHNNAWRPWRAFEGYAWEQCIYTNNNGATVGWNYDWGPGRTFVNGNPNPSGDYYVRSYPELIYGVKDEYRTSAPKTTTGLPVQVDQMPGFRIDYSYDGPEYGESRIVDASNNSRFPNGTTISGERNVSIESFFYETDAAGNCSEGIVRRNGGTNHVYEVMVWLDAGAERLPAGPGDFVADLTIRGDAYKVYTKGADNRYVAFVAQNPQTTGTIYWNDFTDWARNNAHQVRELFGARSNSVQIQDDWCMANIIVGTEIFWGAGEMNIYDWTITQTQ